MILHHEQRLARCVIWVAISCCVVGTCGVGCPQTAQMPQNLDVTLPGGRVLSAEYQTGPSMLANTTWSCDVVSGSVFPSPLSSLGGFLGNLKRSNEQFVARVEFRSNGEIARFFDNTVYFPEILGSQLIPDGQIHPAALPGLTYQAGSYGGSDGNDFGFAAPLHLWLWGQKVGRGTTYAYGTVNGDQMSGTFGYSTELLVPLGPVVSGGSTEFEFSGTKEQGPGQPPELTRPSIDELVHRMLTEAEVSIVEDPARLPKELVRLALEQEYLVEHSKWVLVLGASAGIPGFGANVVLYIDLVDLFEVTAEGREQDFCTVWFEVGATLAGVSIWDLLPGVSPVLGVANLGFCENVNPPEFSAGGGGGGGGAGYTLPPDPLSLPTELKLLNIRAFWGWSALTRTDSTFSFAEDIQLDLSASVLEANVHLVGVELRRSTLYNILETQLVETMKSPSNHGQAVFEAFVSTVLSNIIVLQSLPDGLVYTIEARELTEDDGGTDACGG